MNILVDIAHPAHVHFFKHAIRSWENNNHKVKITTRNIPTALHLLAAYGLQYEIVSTPRTGAIGLGIELLIHTSRLLPRMNKWKIDVCVSIGGTFTVFAGMLTGCRRIVFTDTEIATTANRITFPLANSIVTPDVYPDDLGEKHKRYKGFHELAYLHPDYFSPDPGVLSRYGLSQDEPFSILRLSAWNAAHDIGINKPSSNQYRLMTDKLNGNGKVIIIPEGDVPTEVKEYVVAIAPEDFHHLLYYAQCCITEGATTAAEAAILGTPSLFISPLRPRITQVYAEYGSIKIANPHDDTTSLIETCLTQKAKDSAKISAEKIITDHIDVTQLLIKTIDDQAG